MGRRLGWIGTLISLFLSNCVDHFLGVLDLPKIVDVQMNYLFALRVIENYNAVLICLIEPNLHYYSLMQSQIEINYSKVKWTSLIRWVHCA